MPTNIFSVKIFVEPAGKDRYDVFIGMKPSGIHVGRVRTGLERKLDIEYKHLIGDLECFYVHKTKGSDYFTFDDLRKGTKVTLRSYQDCDGWPEAGWIQIWTPHLRLWNEDGTYKTRWHR